VLDAQAAENKRDRERRRHGGQFGLAVEHGDERRANQNAQAQHHTDEHVDPEEGADLLVGDLVLLDSGHGQPGVFEHGSEVDHHGDHADQAVVGGGEQPGEDHRAGNLQDKPNALGAHGRHAAANGLTGQVAAQMFRIEKVILKRSFCQESVFLSLNVRALSD